MTLSQRLAAPLLAVLWHRLTDSSEAKHRRQFHRCLNETPRMESLVAGVEQLARLAAIDGRFAADSPTDEELGVWCFTTWPDIRPLAIIAGAEGESL